MPKSLLSCNVGLLLVLSILVFPSAADLLGSGEALLASTAQCLGIVALALGAIMALTEVFSGMRWPPLIAVVATVIGLVAVCGKAEVPTVSVWSWAVAWASVVAWFAVLAARARSNR